MGPFDGHLTLIDRSIRRDGAFNRADARASAPRIIPSLARDALCGSSNIAADEWFMALHVALARSRIIHPGCDDDVARVSRTCLTPVEMISPLSND